MGYLMNCGCVCSCDPSMKWDDLCSCCNCSTNGGTTSTYSSNDEDYYDNGYTASGHSNSSKSFIVIPSLILGAILLILLYPREPSNEVRWYSTRAVISFFESNAFYITRGESVTISWSASNARTIRISPKYWAC